MKQIKCDKCGKTWDDWRGNSVCFTSELVMAELRDLWGGKYSFPPTEDDRLKLLLGFNDSADLCGQCLTELGGLWAEFLGRSR